jgi:hypothetical protein
MRSRREESAKQNMTSTEGEARRGAAPPGAVTDERALLILACAISEILSSERAGRLQNVRDEPTGRISSMRDWRLGGRYWVEPGHGTGHARARGWRQAS